jgi:hypothetical protein
MIGSLQLVGDYSALAKGSATSHWRAVAVPARLHMHLVEEQEEHDGGGEVGSIYTSN